MPADLFVRIDLDKIEPNFLNRALAVIAQCRARGADYYAIRGFSTYAEQMALWTQGRTRPGPIVTAAKGGESAHNFGIAIDFARDGDLNREGLQPDWNPADYVILGEECIKQGLVWGGNFSKPDRPHVQLAGFVTATQLAPVRTAFEKGGLKEAWLFLNTSVDQRLLNH